MVFGRKGAKSKEKYARRTESTDSRIITDDLHTSYLSKLGKAIKKKPRPGDPWIAPPTFGQKWHILPFYHKVAYCIYIFALLPLIICVSLLMFPLWVLPIDRFKPTLQTLGHGGDTFRAVYGARDAISLSSKKSPEARSADWTQARDIFAPLGYGGFVRVHREGKMFAHFMPPMSNTRRSRWRGFWMRVWDMYTLERDLIGMMTKQGLQLVGVWCGVTLLAMQVTMMATELSGGQLERYTDAATSGGNTDFLQADGKCGYVSGTGIANWSSGWQPFIWYAAYHSALGIMCILFIAEEFLNAPLGLLAPTHSRAGSGYTIMFLAVSTMNTSPNWGWKRMIPIHQTLLTVIIFIGFYNVLRVFMAHFDCTSSNEFGLMNLREHRTALRPWTEEQWGKALKWMLSTRHLTQDEVDDLSTLQEVAYNLKAASEAMDRRLQPAEQFHQAVVECVRRSSTAEKPNGRIFAIHDSVPQLLRLYRDEQARGYAEQVAEKLDGMGDMKYTNWRHQYDHLSAAIFILEAADNEVQDHWNSRRLLYGNTIRYKPPNSEEYHLYAKPRDSNYFGELYHQDRMLIFRGDHPIIVPCARKYRLVYKGDIIPQLGTEYAAAKKTHASTGKWPQGNEGVSEHFEDGTFRFNQVRREVCRWETEEEYAVRAGRSCKEGDDYEGIHAWFPPDLYLKREITNERKTNKVWYVLMDIRRMYAASIGAGMLFVHVALLWNNLGTGTNNWPSYRAQHEAAAKLWQSNGGLPNDQCQYFQGSNLPIWIRPGEGSIKGVFSIMSTFALWEFFLINMSFAVILVALCNSKIWGMAFPYPFTLVGPRLSSVSVGYTLGLLGVATLQLSLFHDNEVLGSIAKGVGYLAIVAFVLYLPINEPMMSEFARRPFWHFYLLSRWAIEYIQYRRQRQHDKEAKRRKKRKRREERKARRQKARTNGRV